MKESARTLVYVAIAAVALAGAWVAKPRPISIERNDFSGTPFFESYDPLKASVLRIVQFDDTTGMRRDFEVARVNGVYSIPSHENYPADAQTQLAEVATSFVDLTRGMSVSDRPGDHALYGVVNPVGATTGASGVGTRVTLEDESGEILADLIVGKQVEDQQGLRYVREPNRDWVYQCAFPTAKLSTKFMDWIEKDLLQIEVSRIKSIVLNNYSIDEFNARIVQGPIMKLDYDSKERTWSLEGLAANERLRVPKIDEMKRAIDELAIVNVHRKPEGLSKALQSAGQLAIDQIAAQSLAGKGYYIMNNQLLSNEGELTVTMQDGVEYVLRFGEVTLNEGDGPQLEVDSADDEDASLADELADDTGRYLFINARFNPDVIPEPSYVPMELIDSIHDMQGPDAEAGEESEEAQAERQEELEKAKQAARDKNETLRKNHETQLEAGRRRVADLNSRFADWYYVISDEVYRKIRLNRDALVETVEVAEPTEPDVSAGEDEAPAEPADAESTPPEPPAESD